MIKCDIPVNGDRVVFVEGMHYMLGMFLANVFDFEVIDH